MFVGIYLLIITTSRKFGTFGKFLGNLTILISWSMRKLSLLSLALLVYTLFSAAQTTPESTIARLEAINRDIWIPFSEAYAAANAEQCIGLHSPYFIRASGGIPGNIVNLEKYAENSRS